MVGEMRGRFRRWLTRPPRPHGATIVNRRVSFLELFYDLVYVAVIGQTGHQLAEHISVRGVVEFAIIFGLIWIAWVNGSLYVELHGGEDGRTRSIVFVQMGILALLAVFTAGTSDRDGTAFSMVYAAFLVFTTWLWYTVHRRDRQDSPSSWRSPGAMWWPWAFPPAVILGSGFLPVEPRLVLWAAFAIAWIAALLVLGRSGSGMSLAATHSLVERFGLFTIIVLGEVVFGVVGGLVSAERDGPTVAVGLLALCIGFGFWWIYFDLASLSRLAVHTPRLPRIQSVCSGRGESRWHTWAHQESPEHGETSGALATKASAHSA